MSYPCLVGYAHHPQAESKQFSDKIILFVIERGAAEVTDRGRVIDGRAVFFVHEQDGVSINHTTAICHLGGATLDNEENYLIKKLFTGGLGMVCVSNQARI